jgi:hypothetical protein
MPVVAWWSRGSSSRPFCLRERAAVRGPAIDGPFLLAPPEWFATATSVILARIIHGWVEYATQLGI